MADLVPIPLDLFDRLRRAGLDVDAILRRAKLPRARFSVPKPLGTTEEFFALWRAVEEESNDPALGLRIGVAVLPDPNNVVSVAAMHAATLGEGLQKLARYKRLVCPERISILVEDGEARLRFEWLFADGQPPTVLTTRPDRFHQLPDDGSHCLISTWHAAEARRQGWRELPCVRGVGRVSLGGHPRGAVYDRRYVSPRLEWHSLSPLDSFLGKLGSRYRRRELSSRQKRIASRQPRASPNRSGRSQTGRARGHYVFSQALTRRSKIARAQSSAMDPSKT